ncbi:MAG: hypothetical protein GWO24_23010, partial [Akkermansiaceae bacterium]|nr:hypothetical protein [Akkermansiaceae bacterium]
DDDVMQNPPADLVAAVQAAAIRAVGKKPEWCRRCTTRIYSHELCLGCAEEQREQDRLDDEKFQQGWEEAKI